MDVKLSHNELYFLIRSFFELNNELYGSLEDLRDKNDKSKNRYKFFSKINIHDFLLKKFKYPLLREYRGTFNLEFAKEKENIDFFALGHPLINEILGYCIEDDFSGTFTIFFLKKDLLPLSFNFNSSQQSELFLFIFSIKFQSFIIEKQICAIIVDMNGKEVEKLADFILKFDNYKRIFLNTNSIEKFNFSEDLIKNLLQKAKKVIIAQTTKWKNEIKALNDKIFTQEKKKKEKIYQHNRKLFALKIDKLKLKLERKINQKPSKKQLKNTNNLTDFIKKQERMNKYKKLEEDIKFLNKYIQSIQKKLDDLSFEYEDRKNDLRKRAQSKYYINLLSYALIKLS